jgi:hypothetical protein
MRTKESQPILSKLMTTKKVALARRQAAKPSLNLILLLPWLVYGRQYMLFRHYS